MKKLLLVDANSLIHRSFHAIPPLTAKDGRPTGALYGLAGALLKVLKEQEPSYVAAAFDRPEPTFRKKMFADYKAHRPKAPDELISQIIGAHELFNKFGINFFEMPGYEADDVIGTFVKKFKKEKGVQIVILTGDLDTLQLVESDKIVVEILKKGVSETMIYDDAAVKERYGLKPTQMTDYKGLVGDASDNIPGVRGIGPKTAEGFLKKYGSLEELFKKMPRDYPVAKKILPFEKEALFSKKLATINCDVPLKIAIGDIEFSGTKEEALIPYLEELGFESIIRRMGAGSGKEKRKEKTLNQGLFAFESKENIEERAVFIKSAGGVPSEKKGEIEVAWSWKPIIKRLIEEGKEIPSVLFDLGVAGWILDPEETNFSPEALDGKFLKDGSGKPMSRLFSTLERLIEKNELENIFYKIEMPLIPVLAWIETWGIRVEGKKLKELGGRMDEQLSRLTKKIYSAAGSPFNINSSQQVAEVIFEKLKIVPAKNKKTSTGRRSTSEDVLSSLRDAHPIIQEILSYRETFKIKTTYVEPLIKLRGADGRIRTSFIQTGTSTGRLSSEKPNLQNIPQESDWSKDLRDAFIAEPGFSFVSIDYAQLELRLLAHMTLEAGLLRAFQENRDIHALTASRIFRVPLEKVTPQERRLGKTLNFGVVYGMGPRAFAQSAGVSLEEAKKFIEDYYREFPKIKKWQERTKKETMSRGYVENLNGRRRWFWNDVRHPKAVGEVERAAINMPLQSLGADIIKMAMIKSFELMEERGWLGKKARLLLTIHDELLFEIRDDILMSAAPALKELMEKIYPLAAPLAAEVKAGKSWGSLQKKNV